MREEAAEIGVGEQCVERAGDALAPLGAGVEPVGEEANLRRRALVGKRANPRDEADEPQDGVGARPALGRELAELVEARSAHVFAEERGEVGGAGSRRAGSHRAAAVEANRMPAPGCRFAADNRWSGCAVSPRRCARARTRLGGMRRAPYALLGIAVVVGCQLPQQQAQTPPPQQAYPQYPPQPYPYPPQPYPPQPYPTYAPTQTAPQPQPPPPAPAPVPTTINENTGVVAFDAPGTFGYACGTHPAMKGAVKVVP